MPGVKCGLLEKDPLPWMVKSTALLLSVNRAAWLGFFLVISLPKRTNKGGFSEREMSDEVFILFYF